MTKQVIHLQPGDEITVICEQPAPIPDPPADHVKGELGIDVSKWQGQVNWDGMLSAGVGFAGIRATMGATGKDEQFRRNWGEALRVGVQRMGYHYFANNTPGKTQVENFLTSLGSDLGELWPVLDVEPTSGQVIADKAANTREIAIWLDELEKRTGKRPMIYTNAWAWSACTTIPGWSANYPLWLAQYTTAPAPKVPLPWTECQVWQFSSGGNLAGTSPLDLNRYGPY